MLYRKDLVTLTCDSSSCKAKRSGRMCSSRRGSLPFGHRSRGESAGGRGAMQRFEEVVEAEKFVKTLPQKRNEVPRRKKIVKTLPQKRNEVSRRKKIAKTASRE